MVVVESALDYQATVDRLVAAIGRRGLTIFCRVDHAAGARDAGLELPPEEVILFGDPRVGTPLMQGSPAVGYELPLRILVWEEGDAVRLGYRDPRELVELFGLQAREPTLERMAALLAALTGEAANNS